MKTRFTLFQRAVGLLLLCFSVSLSSLQAQMRVGQPAGSPDLSAALEVSGGPYANGSTYRGIAPPKVALTQTNVGAPVTNPATGLLVYNTAKVGDVTPGYYYWEGSRWLRFTTSSTGAARIAASPGGGQYVPAYTIDEVRSLTTTPANIILVEPGREGLFSYVANNTLPDNGGTILVTTSSSNPGKHYRRVFDGPVNVRWFGANGLRDSLSGGPTLYQLDLQNTQAIQAAINYANLATGQVGDGLYPQSKGISNVVYIPSGTYTLLNTINLPGTVTVQGEEGCSIGGTLLRTKYQGYNLFALKGATDGGQSSAVTIRGLRFHPTEGVESSVIYSGDPTTSLYHSLRVEDCWFQIPTGSPNQHIYTGLKSDDVKFTNCTFDFGPNITSAAFILGSADNVTYKITNFAMTNCSGYNVSGGLVKVINADGVLLEGNRIFGVPGGQTPFVVDAISGGSILGRRIQLIGNSFNRVNKILATNWDGAMVVGNTIDRATGRLFEFGSNNTQGHRFTQNIITGTFSNTISVNGSSVPDAPISSYGGSVSNSVFDNTIYDSTGTSSVAYYLPNSSQANSIYTRQVTGFAQVANTAASSIINSDLQLIKTNNLSDLTNVTQARTNLGLKTIALQDASNVAITGGAASLSTVTVTGSLTIPNGSFTTPGLFFPGTATGIYKGSNSELTLRGPVAGGTPSATFTSLGRTDLNINGNNATDFATLNWSQAGISIWSAYVDGSKNWNLLRQGGITPISITPSGNMTLSGNTTISNLTVSNAITLPAAFSATPISTAGWSVGTYSQIVPQATLEAGAAYLLKLQWHKTGGGVDDISQVYWLTTMTSYSNVSANADITPTDVASYGNSNYRIRIRRKVPVNSTNVTYGLEATISDTALATQGGYFTFTLTKF